MAVEAFDSLANTILGSSAYIFPWGVVRKKDLVEYCCFISKLVGPLVPGRIYYIYIQCVMEECYNDDREVKSGSRFEYGDLCCQKLTQLSYTITGLHPALYRRSYSGNGSHFLGALNHID